MWCKVVHLENSPMAQRRIGHEKSVRASVSFSDSQYEELQRIADEKRVSLAWIVRDAIERYICDDTQSTKTTTKAKSK
jgi:metal-responsive CopG/Arc/MetJ family transcriptional regulator